MSVLASRKVSWSLIPRGIVALFFIQIVSTLSFSVLYSTLVLYMKGRLGMPVTAANSIMGVFIAFNFGLHLLGGYLGGRLFSYRALFCIGMVAQTTGCILLSLGGMNSLYYGLAAFLTGSGLNVTCVNCMLTQRFTPEDSRRETAFLWNYAGMNIGFFAGFSLSGLFQITQNYQALFLLSSLGNMIAFVICLICWRQLEDKETIYSRKEPKAQSKSNLFGIGVVLALPFILSLLLHYADGANKLVVATGIIMLVVIIYLAYQQPTQEAKDKMIAFAILMIVGTIFWMLYQIGPMGLTIFIAHNVIREYGSWVIPPQWFQNINTITIVIGGPILGLILNKMRGKGIQVNIPTQFTLALLFIGLAFVILPIGINYANSEGLVSPNWVVASFILQSMGELLISPIGYAMIGYLAPSSLQGVMMGMWMLNSGVGATLSSYSSNLMVVGQESTNALITNKGYSNVFLSLGLFAILSAGMLCILIPKLKKLMQNNALKSENKINAHLTERVVLVE